MHLEVPVVPVPVPVPEHSVPVARMELQELQEVLLPTPVQVAVVEVAVPVGKVAPVALVAAVVE